jgi:hypothetical protein
MVIPTGTKKVSRPRLVPDLGTGTKGGTFSPDLLVPAPEPRQKAL